jgi:hypothetical protein
MAYVQKNSPFKQVEDGVMIPKKRVTSPKPDVSTKSRKTTYGDPFLDQKPPEDPKTPETTEKPKTIGKQESISEQQIRKEVEEIKKKPYKKKTPPKR